MSWNLIRVFQRWRIQDCPSPVQMALRSFGSWYTTGSCIGPVSQQHVLGITFTSDKFDYNRIAAVLYYICKSLTLSIDRNSMQSKILDVNLRWFFLYLVGKWDICHCEGRGILHRVDRGTYVYMARKVYLFSVIDIQHTLCSVRELQLSWKKRSLFVTHFWKIHT